MGGIVMNLNYHCCIHESNFKDECSKKDNVETIEQEAMKIGDKTIERASSFFTDISPTRRSSKNKVDDD
jgi:hypothetical protein